MSQLKYCHVQGGKNNLNYHAWLDNSSIERLLCDGCNIKVLKISNFDYEY